MHGHRRKPISNKLKKSLLQQKREKKRTKNEHQKDEKWWSDDEPSVADKEIPAAVTTDTGVVVQSLQDTNQAKDERTASRNKDKATGAQALYSQFEKLSREEIAQGRRRSMRPLERVDKTAMEVSFESVHPAILEFPQRPKWHAGQSKASLLQQEATYFEQWMRTTIETHAASSLSFFERNLEVWRQLWRVLEMSDLLLFVVDVRHPVLHFPPSLYTYLTKTLKKPLVVVLNKVDLVSAETVVAWRIYLEEQFPGTRVAAFGSFRRDTGPNMADDTLESMRRNVKKKRTKRYAAVGIAQVLLACRDVMDTEQQAMVDWDTVVAKYGKDEAERDQPEDDSGDASDDEGSDVEEPSSLNTQSKDEDDGENEDADDATATKKKRSPYVTIGLVGHPNVGKSSLINSIFGRTVVSASRTPGHTKHFQTLHLSPTLRLCDGPGLVFPSLIPRSLQILSGIYNVAQVQEPYSAVQYLAERIPVEQVLRLKPPSDDEDYVWTAWDICEAFAIERGFMTARGARPDVSRAANQLLRLVNLGRLLLSFKPPGFYTDPGLYLRKARDLNIPIE